MCRLNLQSRFTETQDIQVRSGSSVTEKIILASVSRLTAAAVFAVKTKLPRFYFVFPFQRLALGK